MNNNKNNEVKPMTTGIKAEDRADAQQQEAILRNRVDNMTDEQLVRYMEQHHKSDVYLVIRDFVSSKRKSAIEKNKELAPRFKQIKTQANESWKHDHEMATNLVVDKACTLVYSTLLKMIKVQQEEIDEMKKAMENNRCHCHDTESDKDISADSMEVVEVHKDKPKSVVVKMQDVSARHYRGEAHCQDRPNPQCEGGKKHGRDKEQDK
jgi:hypothetical protein